jgi:small subunit ribosomal protein S7
MSRRRRAEKRDILPDPKFGDMVLAKFTNSLMREGKKSVAERIIYGAFEDIGKRTGQDPVKVFHDALDNVRPHVEVRSRRVGGATYQVPVEVRSDRAQALAIRWLISSARGRSETTMVGRLSRELMDAAQNRGAAVKKREDTHRMADANKHVIPPNTAGALPQYRHHGAHRCRQDDDDGARPLLYRALAQAGRSP